MVPNASARRFVVHGRVQGVGFRYFVERAANDLSLSGYVKNRADGSVEVYAGGDPDGLGKLKELLADGPRWARVERIEESEPEAPPGDAGGFHITY